MLFSKSRSCYATKVTHTLFDMDSVGFSTLRFDKKFGYAELETYAKDLRFISSKPVTKARRKYVGVVNILDHKYLVYFRYRENKKENTHERVSLYAMKMDSTGACIESDSIELIPPFEMRSNYYRGNFATSPDLSRIVVYDFEEEGDIPGVDNLTNFITVRVFDVNFKLLWKRKVNLSPSGSAKRTVSIKKLSIDNQGRVIILTDVFKNHRTYNLREPTADPTIFIVGQQPNDFFLFKPKLGNYFFNQQDFKFDKKGDIIWYGFYSEQKYYQQRGYFYLKIKQDLSAIQHKKVKPFSDSLMLDLLHRKKAKPNMELRSYKLVDSRLTKDNHFIFTAELQPPSNYNVRSNDILLMHLDDSGDLVWSTSIYKHADESSKLNVFLSHWITIDTIGNTYVLHNEGVYADDHAVLTRISPEGRQRRKRIFNYLNQGNLLCPRLSFRVNDDQIFICRQDKFFTTYDYGLLNLSLFFED